MRANYLYMLNSYDLSTVVCATGNTGMVRLFHFLALGADRKIRRLEVFVGAPFVPAGL
jgi:hypothetical protein